MRWGLCISYLQPFCPEWPEMKVGVSHKEKFETRNKSPPRASVFAWAVCCIRIFWGRLRFLWAWHILVKMNSASECWHESWLHHIPWPHATSRWPRALLALALVTWFKTAVEEGRAKGAWGRLTWHPSWRKWPTFFCRIRQEGWVEGNKINKANQWCH